MGIKMWYYSVQSFDVMGITINVWGLMLAIGAFLAWLLFDFNLLWRKIKLDSSWLVMGFIFFGLVGARLVQVLLNIDFYAKDWWEIFRVWNGGMASYGAFMFSFLFLFFYVFRFKEKMMDLLDAAVPSMFLALSLARFGCFVINDHIGKVVNDIPWAIMVQGNFRHPISLYYLLMALLMFVIFGYMYYGNKFRGSLFGMALIFYGVYRSVLDILFKDFMGDNLSFIATMVSGLTFVFIGLFMLTWFRRKFLINS